MFDYHTVNIPISVSHTTLALTMISLPGFIATLKAQTKKLETLTDSFYIDFSTKIQLHIYFVIRRGTQQLRSSVLTDVIDLVKQKM